LDELKKKVRMTSFIYSQTPKSSTGFWIVAFSLFFVSVLSFLSLIEFCVEHCSANQNYLLFGVHFAKVGLVAFPLLFIFHLLSPKYPLLGTLTAWSIAASLGAELMFIAVQYYQIGNWCPLCLSIAAAIALAGSVYLIGYIQNFKNAMNSNNRGEIMNKIKQGLSSLSMIFLGFFLAFIGISKINPAEAAAAEMKQKLAFGKINSPIEVYFISDWYCTACHKVEPIFEKIYPELRTEATVFFIDYAIHKKSTNFIPYNIAFMINNKSQYFKARHALQELAEKTDAPTDKDVVAELKKYNIQYKEVPYLEVKTGMDFFDKVVEKFNLNSTPVVVVTNTKTNKVVTLDGAPGITEEKIKEAIQEVKGTKAKESDSKS
jgi:thiol-disulfide isomerase/thioredoxin